MSLPLRHHEIMCKAIDLLRLAEDEALQYWSKNPKDEDARRQLRGICELLRKAYAL